MQDLTLKQLDALASTLVHIEHIHQMLGKSEASCLDGIQLENIRKTDRMIWNILFQECAKGYADAHAAFEIAREDAELLSKFSVLESIERFSPGSMASSFGAVYSDSQILCKITQAKESFNPFYMLDTPRLFWWMAAADMARVSQMLCRAYFGLSAEIVSSLVAMKTTDIVTFCHFAESRIRPAFSVQHFAELAIEPGSDADSAVFAAQILSHGLQKNQLQSFRWGTSSGFNPAKDRSSSKALAICYASMGIRSGQIVSMAGVSRSTADEIYSSYNPDAGKHERLAQCPPCSQEESSLVLLMVCRCLGQTASVEDINEAISAVSILFKSGWPRLEGGSLEQNLIASVVKEALDFARSSPDPVDSSTLGECPEHHILFSQLHQRWKKTGCPFCKRRKRQDHLRERTASRRKVAARP